MLAQQLITEGLCCQVGKNRFQRMFLPSHSLDTVSSSDMLFCFELLSKEIAKEKVVLLRVQQVRNPLTSIFLDHLFYVCGPDEISFSGFAFLAEAAGSRYPHLKVCCLPEASHV